MKGSSGDLFVPVERAFLHETVNLRQSRQEHRDQSEWQQFDAQSAGHAPRLALGQAPFLVGAITSCLVGAITSCSAPHVTGTRDRQVLKIEIAMRM